MGATAGPDLTAGAGSGDRNPVLRDGCDGPARTIAVLSGQVIVGARSQGSPGPLRTIWFPAPNPLGIFPVGRFLGGRRGSGKA